jgi:hypothetical protein
MAALAGALKDHVTGVHSRSFYKFILSYLWVVRILKLARKKSLTENQMSVIDVFVSKYVLAKRTLFLVQLFFKYCRRHRESPSKSVKPAGGEGKNPFFGPQLFMLQLSNLLGSCRPAKDTVGLGVPQSDGVRVKGALSAASGLHIALLKAYFIKKAAKALFRSKLKGKRSFRISWKKADKALKLSKFLTDPLYSARCGNKVINVAPKYISSKRGLKQQRNRFSALFSAGISIYGGLDDRMQNGYSQTIARICKNGIKGVSRGVDDISEFQNFFNDSFKQVVWATSRAGSSVFTNAARLWSSLINEKSLEDAFREFDVILKSKYRPLVSYPDDDFKAL